MSACSHESLTPQQLSTEINNMDIDRQVIRRYLTPVMMVEHDVAPRTPENMRSMLALAVGKRTKTLKFDRETIQYDAESQSTRVWSTISELQAMTNRRQCHPRRRKKTRKSQHQRTKVFQQKKAMKSNATTLCSVASQTTNMLDHTIQSSAEPAIVLTLSMLLCRAALLLRMLKTVSKQTEQCYNLPLRPVTNVHYTPYTAVAPDAVVQACREVNVNESIQSNGCLKHNNSEVATACATPPTRDDMLKETKSDTNKPCGPSRARLKEIVSGQQRIIKTLRNSLRCQQRRIDRFVMDPSIVVHNATLAPQTCNSTVHDLILPFQQCVKDSVKIVEHATAATSVLNTNVDLTVAPVGHNNVSALTMHHFGMQSTTIDEKDETGHSACELVTLSSDLPYVINEAPCQEHESGSTYCDDMNDSLRAQGHFIEQKHDQSLVTDTGLYNANADQHSVTENIPQTSSVVCKSALYDVQQKMKLLAEHVGSARESVNVQNKANCVHKTIDNLVEGTASMRSECCVVQGIDNGGVTIDHNRMSRNERSYVGIESDYEHCIITTCTDNKYALSDQVDRVTPLCEVHTIPVAPLTTYVNDLTSDDVIKEGRQRPKQIKTTVSEAYQTLTVHDKVNGSVEPLMQPITDKSDFQVTYDTDSQYDTKSRTEVDQIAVPDFGSKRSTAHEQAFHTPTPTKKTQATNAPPTMSDRDENIIPRAQPAAMRSDLRVQLTPPSVPLPPCIPKITVRRQASATAAPVTNTTIVRAADTVTPRDELLAIMWKKKLEKIHALLENVVTGYLTTRTLRDDAEKKKKTATPIVKATVTPVTELVKITPTLKRKMTTASPQPTVRNTSRTAVQRNVQHEPIAEEEQQELLTEEEEDEDLLSEVDPDEPTYDDVQHLKLQKKIFREGKRGEIADDYLPTCRPPPAQTHRGRYERYDNDDRYSSSRPKYRRGLSWEEFNRATAYQQDNYEEEPPRQTERELVARALAPAATRNKTKRSHDDSMQEPYGTAFGRCDSTPYVVKPPIFNGQGWESFRLQFETCANANQWTYEERSLMLPTTLRGDTVFLLQQQPTHRSWTYDELMSQLDNHYVASGSDVLMRATLQHTKQRLGQSVNDFIDDIYKATATIPRDDTGERDRLMLSTLIDGLNDPALKRELFKQRASTMSQAVQMIHEHELILKVSGANTECDATNHVPVKEVPMYHNTIGNQLPFEPTNFTSSDHEQMLSFEDTKNSCDILSPQSVYNAPDDINVQNKHTRTRGRYKGKVYDPNYTRPQRKTTTQDTIVPATDPADAATARVSTTNQREGNCRLQRNRYKGRNYNANYKRPVQTIHTMALTNNEPCQVNDSLPHVVA